MFAQQGKDLVVTRSRTKEYPSIVGSAPGDNGDVGAPGLTRASPMCATHISHMDCAPAVLSALGSGIDAALCGSAR